MLIQRIITAAILVPAVIVAVLWLPDPLFAALTALIFLGAGWEWTGLAGLHLITARILWLAMLTLIMAFMWYLRSFMLCTMLVIGVTWWLLACLWLRHIAFAAAPSRKNGYIKLLTGILVIIPAWLALVQIHHENSARGSLWTLLILFTIWTADSVAYLIGRTWGKRKLAPQISPGKTWVGAWAGLLAGTTVMVTGSWQLGNPHLTLAGWIVLATLTVSASIVGDLLESLMKRHAQRKDSGVLIPGHGGLLDRLDSLFAALPIMALGLMVTGQLKVIL